VRISIGDIHTEFDKHDEALVMYSEAIMLSKANGHTDGLEEAEMQDLALEMARCLERVGKDDQALRIYKKLLARVEEKRAGDCKSAARLLCTIAKLCSRTEAAFQSAVACFDRAISMSRRLAGSDDDMRDYGYERGLAGVAIKERSQVVERGLRLGDIVVFKPLSSVDMYYSWLLPGMLGVFCKFDVDNWNGSVTVDWDSSTCQVGANCLVPLRVSQIEVTGCAVSCVNGSYIECETERSGRKCFGKADGNGSIYFDGQYWKLRQNSYSGLFDGCGIEERSDPSWTFSQLPLGDSIWPPPVWGKSEHADLEMSVLGGLVSDRLRCLSAEILEEPPGDTIADTLARKENARRAAAGQRVTYDFAEFEAQFSRSSDEALGSMSMQARY
jgi:tetratricopeptide (TPR) repeat protein